MLYNGTLTLYKLIRGAITRETKRQIIRRLHSVGIGLQLEWPTTIVFPERMAIGDWVHIEPRCYLNARGGLDIGDHVIVAPEVLIMSAMHNHMNATMVPYDNTELLRPVTIERCAWLGMRSIVMPGVRIGEGSIIATGAVVTKSCAPGSIIGGNPGRLIGYRDMERYRENVSHGRYYLKSKVTLGLDKVESLDPR